MKYHVVYERDETGWWLASVPSLQGCHTQGRTLDEAKWRVKEAIEVTIDADLPDDTEFTEEIVEFQEPGTDEVAE